MEESRNNADTGETGTAMADIENKGTVLVLGNSGVGKSTLINAVLGEDIARTGRGTTGTTGELAIYDSPKTPFRVIDTVGFEPGYLQQRKAVHSVNKWSKEVMAGTSQESAIGVIWFCVDGTAGKLFSQTITNLLKAAKSWPSVPIIAVITKSYSHPDRQENISLVKEAFAGRKSVNRLRRIIPVVAQIYSLNDSMFAPPEGIIDLIDATNELMPEGRRAAREDMSTFKLQRKRMLAHSIVAASTTAAAVVGAVPIPFADVAILGPVEIGEVNALAKLYGISDIKGSKALTDSLVDVGTTSVAAKALASTLKAIPGIAVGAAVINAVIAASIAAGLGEASVYAFEQVYLGKKTVDDINWARKLVEDRLSDDFLTKLTAMLKDLGHGQSTRTSDIVNLVMGLFFQKPGDASTTSAAKES